ncbi:MAG: FAD-dependent oxidoreductase [Magnetococcales bacterium]|nr:FAD-dependent oxidoreductase [Magnetococcales bacterium]
MSDTISITLNGEAVQAPRGSTIRQVAQSRGIHIPTFCHDDRLKPFASCFLCVVEVEKARTLLPACSTQVAPGMVIHTDSARVTDSRKTALDLLLSDHAGDCIAPCEATCPANIDIQGYVAHIANGNFAAAVRLIKQRNPLPVVCGRICPHPCESECRRALVDEPVAINPLKRFSAEHEVSHGPFVEPPGADTGQRVAVVGGGPAGLSAAYFLRRMGHGVEIFEALPELGGMARYGIPRFRLPWDLMDREIKTILDMGVTVHYGQRLGTDFTIADLKQRGFGAVLLAIGAHKAKPMRVENEDVPGVVGGVDFLRMAVLGQPTGITPGCRVAVLGGGDTAMDCARVARRLGAKVTLLYRRTKAEMPALEVEQEETIEEGVKIRYLTAPSKVIVGPDGRAEKLQVITMMLGEPDDSGRRRPMPMPNSEEDLPFDLIIPAIGQDPDLSCIASEPRKPDTTRWQTFVYDEKTNVTTLPGVFAAGDCAFGPDILIRAIGEGRRAAMAIDLCLKGADITLKKEYAISRGRLRDLEEADFSPRFIHKKRARETTFEAEDRLHNQGGWAPINAGLDQVQAMAEAARCIKCGCNARFDCDLRRYATLYNGTEARLAGAKRKYPEDARHPLIRIEPDKCITCASCVRVCSETRDIHALAFINRGFVTHIGPNFGDSLQSTGCDACGMCIDVCPTGTLAPNTGQEAGPWVGPVVTTSCSSCSRGCGLEVHTAAGRVVKVRSIDGDPINGASICAEGRFGYQLLGREHASDLDVTVGIANGILNMAGKGAAVVVSPFLTVEEIYAAVLLARKRNAMLYYPAAGSIGGPRKPLGRYRSEGNVALLTRLGAQPWQGDRNAVALVMVGSRVEAPGVDIARRILIAPSRQQSVVATFVETADPLETIGAFLNRDGALVFLTPILGHQTNRAGFRILARLAGEPGLDLATLRQRLVAEVPELAAIATMGQRIVATGLPPVLAAVAADQRQSAFKAHMGGLGLTWD